MSKEGKMHYIDMSLNWTHLTVSFCGLHSESPSTIEFTSYLKHVTCKNCKRAIASRKRKEAEFQKLLKDFKC